MIINGREVKFRRTVGADMEIGELCPGRDLGRIGDLFGDGMTFSDNVASVTRIMLILNKWAEATARLNDPDYVPAPLTEDEILTLDETDFADLQQEMMDAWARDTKRTVETAPIKGAKKNAATKSK